MNAPFVNFSSVSKNTDMIGHYVGNTGSNQGVFDNERVQIGTTFTEYITWQEIVRMFSTFIFQFFH